MRKISFQIRACYRLAVALLAVAGLFCMYGAFGDDANRLFATWFLFLTVAYYLLSSAYSTSHGRNSLRPLAATLQGAALVSGIILFWLNGWGQGQYQFLTPEGSATNLICIILPILILLDWLIFSSKGNYRLIEPWYWLILPILYVCWIMATAIDMRSDANLRYPFEFTLYEESELGNFGLRVANIFGVILAGGYVVALIDFVFAKIEQYVERRKAKRAAKIVAEQKRKMGSVGQKPARQNTPQKKKSSKGNNKQQVKQESSSINKKQRSNQKANSSKSKQVKTNNSKKKTVKTSNSARKKKTIESIVKSIEESEQESKNPTRTAKKKDS